MTNFDATHLPSIFQVIRHPIPSLVPTSLILSQDSYPRIPLYTRSGIERINEENTAYIHQKELRNLSEQQYKLALGCAVNR